MGTAIPMGSRRSASAIAATLLVAGLAACSFASSPAISGESLAGRITSGDAPVVLDVRSESEYTAAHVPGAIHIPFQSVASRHEELAVDKDRTIVVYCAHGPRAAWAGRALRKAGYSDIVYLAGHMVEWEDASRPLEASSPPSAE
jgi:rhodanese-related sulfurtransferase